MAKKINTPFGVEIYADESVPKGEAYVIKREVDLGLEKFISPEQDSMTILSKVDLGDEKEGVLTESMLNDILSGIRTDLYTYADSVFLHPTAFDGLEALLGEDDGDE